MEKRGVTTRNGKEGHDLNVILREILQAVREERGWSEAKLGEELGIPQRTMNRLLSDEGKFDVDRLSTICAALEMNPVALFASHPEYKHEARAFMRFGKDALYDRFRTLLSPDEARKLVIGVEEQKALGIFDVISASVQGMIDAAKRARQKAIRETKADRPREA